MEISASRGHGKIFGAAVKNGMAGFVIFFSILVFTKLLGSMVGAQYKFSLAVEDILLSVIGFVLLFLIKILENFRPKKG